MNILLKGAMWFVCIWAVGFFIVSTLGSSSFKKSAPHITPLPENRVDIGAEFSSNSAVPFTFSTGQLSVKIVQHAISPVKDADYLFTNYSACGPKYRPKSYFPEVVATMKKLPETAYTIGTFQIVLIPNLLGYKNLPALQEDFFACPEAVGQLVPADMNDHWLVFTRSCATTDAVCKKISEVVTSSIHIKP